MNALLEAWPAIAGVLGLFVTIAASAHAILLKRDVRAAIGWVGLIWLAPMVGAGLYLLLGVNRIKRKAASMQRLLPEHTTPERTEESVEGLLEEAAPGLVTLSRLVTRLSRRRLTAGNDVRPLVGGDAAYPAMLEAIGNAERSITLCTYIFDNDRVGVAFVDALAEAHQRGVEVRVLVDAVGLRYSWWNPVDRLLRQRGVPVARFMPTRLPWRMAYMNLRNHRKSLVVDGRLAYTGGMNIREGHRLSLEPKDPIEDVHFQVTGPVVAQLQESFAEDWLFTTKERLDETVFWTEIGEQGGVVARALSDGPDEDFDKLRWTLLGALSCAQHSVRVVTPYFLPDAALITALGVAARRGVEVDVVIPERGNMMLIQWASTAQLWQVLEHGVRVHLSPPPFDHSKLVVVDSSWVLLGSHNWDPRSLRLNFELDVECYSAAFGTQLHELVDRKLEVAREITLAEVDARSLPVRLRDGLARLASPYL